MQIYKNPELAVDSSFLVSFCAPQIWTYFDHCSTSESRRMQASVENGREINLERNISCCEETSFESPSLSGKHEPVNGAC